MLVASAGSGARRRGRILRSNLLRTMLRRPNRSAAYVRGQNNSAFEAIQFTGEPTTPRFFRSETVLFSR